MRSRNSSAPSVPAPGLALLGALLSLALPGIGHVLIGAWRRGILLFLSLASMLGLMIWRISLVGRREPDFPSKVSKAFELQPILLAVAVVLALIYLWIALDLVLASRRARGANSPALWFLILAAFFAMGWQIGDIDLLKLATQP